LAGASFRTILRDILTKDNKGLQETIIRAADYLKKLEDKQTGIEYFETLMRYVLNAGQKLTKQDVEEIIVRIGSTYPEGSEVVMTLAEQLREEGLIKGIEKGIEKGKQEERLNTTIKLLTKKFGFLPEDLRTSISELDPATLEGIIEDIFNYESLEDVKRYIQ
jgi:predicted transposase YdaD